MRSGTKIMIALVAFIALASVANAFWCGVQHGGKSCSSGNCCSKYGVCGTSDDHCMRSRGCQAQCKDDPPSDGDSACTRAGGSCKSESSCHSPDYSRSGLCPGPSYVKCCFEGTSTTGGGSGDSNWLTSAGPYTVENLDRTGWRTFYNHNYPVTKFLLHTIEGTWPSNGDWEAGIRSLDRGVWPHFIVAKDRSGRLRISQFAPLNKRGKALEGDANGMGVIQIEVGAKAASPFTSHAADLTAAVKALYAAVSAVTPSMPVSVDPSVKWCGDNSCSCTSAYGYYASQRLSSSRFISVRGLVGHQHAPRNSHWDPGCINPQALL